MRTTFRLIKTVQGQNPPAQCGETESSSVGLDETGKSWERRYVYEYSGNITAEHVHYLLDNYCDMVEIDLPVVESVTALNGSAPGGLVITGGLVISKEDNESTGISLKPSKTKIKQLKLLHNKSTRISPQPLKTQLEELDKQEMKLATLYLNMSARYCKRSKMTRLTYKLIDYYKECCEALLPELRLEKAIYRTVIALGSFVEFGKNKTLKQSTIDFLRAQLSSGTKKLRRACCLLYADFV